MGKLEREETRNRYVDSLSNILLSVYINVKLFNFSGILLNEN